MIFLIYPVLSTIFFIETLFENHLRIIGADNFQKMHFSCPILRALNHTFHSFQPIDICQDFGDRPVEVFGNEVAYLH